MTAEPLAKARACVIGGTIAFSIVTVVLVADKPWSDGRTAAVLDLTENALFVAYLARYRDAGMGRLLLFGFVFGLVELIADALCVCGTHTLDYSVAHSLMIGLSPWWMPLAWMTVAAQIGYVGSVLINRFGLAWGMTLTALLGAVNLPFYEEMAYHAHWWRYRSCLMLGHAPVYIIVSELIIGLALGPLARAVLAAASWTQTIKLGVLGGISTIIGASSATASSSVS